MQDRLRSSWITAVPDHPLGTNISEPDYSAAVKVLKKHYEGLCARAATEILEDPDRSDELRDEILISYWQKFCAIDSVYAHLESRVRVSSLAEARKVQRAAKDIVENNPPLPRKLRVATIHCRADIVTESINEWLAKNADHEVVSINFTQLSSGPACVILHREK